MAAMRDDTPYHQRPPTEVAREQACMREIFAEAPPVDYIWETFAGTGVTAEVLRERFPRATINATDLDAQCVQTYNEKGYGTAFQEDATAFLKRLPEPARSWGVSMDYNKFTLYDLMGRGERWKVELLRRVLALDPVWVQLTDSACRYLHLNWHRYGLPACDMRHYTSELEARVREQPRGRSYWLDCSSRHHAASYHLFVRR